MNPITAKKIGSNVALKSVTIGLVIAYSIMVALCTGGYDSFVHQLLWIVDWLKSEFLPHTIIGIIAFYTCGYFFGRMAGKDILVKRLNYIWVGSLWGLFTLLCTVFLASLTGFFLGIKHSMHYLQTIEDMKHSTFIYDNFIDYIVKPLFWFSIFGFLPAIGIGIWLGWRIEKKSESPQQGVIPNAK